VYRKSDIVYSFISNTDNSPDSALASLGRSGQRKNSLDMHMHLSNVPMPEVKVFLTFNQKQS